MAHLVIDGLPVKNCDFPSSCELISLLEVVIFHRHVKLPEGIFHQIPIISLCDG